MQIWVDADACPKVIKETLFRAAQRAKMRVILVANRSMYIPPSPYIQMLQVPAGFDVADNAIVQRMAAGDLVITGDIPLASEVIDHGGYALSPRGELYSPETIKGRLTMRDFMDTLRGSGMMISDGPPALSHSERQAFAAHLDRILARFAKANPSMP